VSTPGQYITSTPPVHPRAANLSDLIFSPGIASNSPARDLKGRWVASNRVRWHKGTPEKIGGWAVQPLVAAGFAFATPASLLLHFDGANGSTTIIDSSSNNFPMTANGTGALSTANPKFGSAALAVTWLAAANGVTTPVTPGGPLDLSTVTGDFTVQGWVNIALPGNNPGFFVSSIIPNYTTGTGAPEGWFVNISTPDATHLELEAALCHTSGTTEECICPATGDVLSDGAYHHIAWVRQGTNMALFFDGQSGAVLPLTGLFTIPVDERTTHGNPYPPPPISVGGTNNPAMGTGATGMIDEVSITRAAVYTPGVNFTPPAAPLPLPVPIQRYIGTVRGACDWASLDTQQWIAFGTECKLYLVNSGTLYDITPIRKTSNLLNPFTTINGQANVNVADTDHRSNVGDHVHVISATAVGGLTLIGDYNVVAIIDDNNYTITAASLATSSVTGGASVTMTYDIYCGLAENGFLYGYGAGPYGGSTYGTPRTPPNGVPAKMRTWSLQNWGEDLVASFSDGEIYWWHRASGPNAPAVLLVNAPVDVQRVLVNADAEFVIAVGASDVTGNADGMNVRWCSEGDLTDWLPVILPVANTAGGQRLNYGSTLVAAIQSRGANFLWSDTQFYQMQFIGVPNIFGFTELGKCSIVGPNAPIDVNGTIFFMGYDDFFIFDGTLRVLPCEMWETVFEDFDRTQAQAVYCSSNRTKNEVQWLYPSSKVPGQMNYVVFNYEDQCWYGGIMPRTCYQDVSAALSGFFETPYAFNNGYLYQHELGVDEVEASGTVAMDWFLQSWDIGMNSDRGILINSMVPNFDRLTKGLQFSYLQKNYPTEEFTTRGPFIVTPTTTKLDARACGTQIALRIERAMVLTSSSFTVTPGNIGGNANGYLNAAAAALARLLTPPPFTTPGGSIAPTAVGAATFAGAMGANLSNHLVLYFVGNVPPSALTSVAGTDVLGVAYTALTANATVLYDPANNVTQFHFSDSDVLNNAFSLAVPTLITLTRPAIVYGQDFRLGVWQSLATQYGRRRSGSSMGEPIDTSGP
jgi:hypothetical protein